MWHLNKFPMKARNNCIDFVKKFLFITTVFTKFEKFYATVANKVNQTCYGTKDAVIIYLKNKMQLMQ